MFRFCILLASLLVTMQAADAQTLSLDSCRAMALRANKQLSASRVKQQIATNVKKTARTKYLPHVDVLAGYEFTSREVSILSDDKKDFLHNLGTNTVGAMGNIKEDIASKLGGLAIGGKLSPEAASTLGGIFGGITDKLAAVGDHLGDRIVDAFRTDTRNVFAGSIMLNQPIYMGGAITAANKMADLGEKMAAYQTDAAEQSVLYNIDQAYWTVVSLRHKQQLADEYLKLVSKLDDDVQKMIKTGVATRADGLKVSVRVNEAEMTKTQVDNGLTLAKMYLCQLCGMPLESDITLADENDDILTAQVQVSDFSTVGLDMRPELQMLSSAVDMTKVSTKLARASYLPQLMLSGGYLISNPNVLNGYEKKFGGMWNVGVLLRIPVTELGYGVYKVRAAKLATQMAKLEYDEAKEKINLQVTQCGYRLKEANKKLVTAQKNIQRAEENLRCANVGFKEGVIETTDVMAAQTAWMLARTQEVDAEIDVRLSEAGLKKALGIR